MPPAAPGANPPGGDPAGPPVRAFGLPGRPPLGTLSPHASGIGSPFPVFREKAFFEKSFGSRPAGAKNSGYLGLAGAQGAFLAFGGTELPPGPSACATGQIWGLYGAVAVGGRACPGQRQAVVSSAAILVCIVRQFAV